MEIFANGVSQKENEFRQPGILSIVSLIVDEPSALWTSLPGQHLNTVSV